MSVFMILWIYLCCGDFAYMSGFEYFIYGCIYELMTWLFEVYAIFPPWCFIVEIFYACWLRIIWRRDIYFLNIYYIRVIYRFNRSRAIQLPHRSICMQCSIWLYMHVVLMIGHLTLFLACFSTPTSEDLWRLWHQ